MSHTWNRALRRHRDLLPPPDPTRFYTKLPGYDALRYMPQSQRARDSHYTDRLAETKRNLFACRVVDIRRTPLIEWVFTVGGFKVTARIMSKAATTGDLELLEWLAPRYNGNAQLPPSVIYGAAKIGNVAVLERVHDTWQSAAPDMLFFMRACGSAILTAAKYNQRATIEWLRAHGHGWNESATTRAASAGHLDMLQWLHERGCPMPVHIASIAARSGRIDMIEWLGTQGYQLCSLAYREAILGGHAVLLDWLHTHKDVAVSFEAWAPAIKRGDKAACEWLLCANCPTDGRAFKHAISCRRLDMVLWLRDHGFASAPSHFALCASKGDIDALEWLFYRGFGIGGDKVTRAAAREGHTNVLDWFHEHSVTQGFVPSVVTAAATGNQWDTVVWLCDHGCPPVDSTICALAVSFGRRDMLEYLYDRGCSWDATSCLYAAQRGHLDILQWLRARECPWDSRLCIDAVERGHLETLKWAITNGCPHSIVECRGRAVAWGWRPIVDWLDGLLQQAPRF